MIWEEKKIQNEKDSEFHIIQPTYLQHSFFFSFKHMQNFKKKKWISKEKRKIALVPVIKGGRTVSRRLLRQTKKKKTQFRDAKNR